MMGRHKIQWSAALLVGVLLLTGCGQKQASSTASSKKATSSVSQKAAGKATAKKASSSTSSSSSTSTATTKTLWDSDKDAKLTAFINEWAPTMQQSYEKYDGTHALKLNTGMVYPTNFNDIDVEGTHNAIGWSADGDGHYAYNVVAIYNYNGKQAQHVTYLFAFHDGQPVALVDQSTNGTPNFTATQNTKVQENFAQIAGTGSQTAPTKSTDDASTALVRDPKTIGVLVREKAFKGDQLKENEQYLSIYQSGGKYWIGTGTSISNVGYTISGDNVTYYMRDFSDGKSTADAGVIAHPTSIKALQDEFYATTAQKQLIDEAVSYIPAIDDQSND